MSRSPRNWPWRGATGRRRGTTGPCVRNAGGFTGTSTTERSFRNRGPGVPRGEEVTYVMHLYPFAMIRLMDHVTVRPGMEWVFDDHARVVERCREMTWDEVRAVAAA